MHEEYVLLLLSGGIDSTACLHFYKDQFSEVDCLFVDYGQPALDMERRAVRSISDYYSINLKELQISGSLEQKDGEFFGRNALFLTLALTQFRAKSGLIAIGIHAGTGYDDCSFDFKRSMQGLFDQYKSKSVEVGAPFINWTKNEIWDYCREIKIPLNLTYSCELGLEQPCNKCKTCKDLKILYADKF